MFCISVGLPQHVTFLVHTVFPTFLQLQRGDGLSCRGPGTLLSRGPFPPHTGAPRAIWADSISPHLLQGEAKPGRSRRTPGARRASISVLTRTFREDPGAAGAVRVRPSHSGGPCRLSLVRDLASWRHLTSAPTSDAGMHPQEPRGTSLSSMPRSWGHGLPSSGTLDPSSGLLGSAPCLVDLCPLCHRCARSRRLQHAFQETGFREFSR